jgi:hypothetical protein
MIFESLLWVKNAFLNVIKGKDKGMIRELWRWGFKGSLEARI